MLLCHKAHNNLLLVLNTRQEIEHKATLLTLLATGLTQPQHDSSRH